MSFVVHILRPCLIGALILLGVVVGGGAASAQSCTTGSTASAFGTYDPTISTPNTTTATITVTCSGAVQLFVLYTITLSPGQSGSQTARAMSSGSGTLSYQVYMDSARTQIWGSGTGGTVSKTDGYLLAVGAPVVNNYTAYNRIPARQSVAPGSYLDTLTVTLTY